MKRAFGERRDGGIDCPDQVDKGAGIPQPHLHSSNQFMFCLKGKYEYTSTGVVLTPGCFYCNPKGNVHGPAVAHEETIVVEMYEVPTTRRSHPGTRTSVTPTECTREMAWPKGDFMLMRFIAGFFALTVSLNANADEFPPRTVTIVSPYQAGGASDIIARILAQKLSERWGKSVIVENRPGANGGIGVTAVARAAADGTTLLAVASSALTINPLFYSKLPYDVENDLAPITRTGKGYQCAGRQSVYSGQECSGAYRLAKGQPGKLSYASQGNGSNGQVTGELFKQRAGIDILHVPYKGSAPAVQDHLGVECN